MRVERRRRAPSVLPTETARAHILAVMMSVGVGITAAVAEDLVAEPAPEWTALFDREHDWTGADGIFSIPLNGREVGAGHDSESRTLILFSDTAIGEVGSAGERLEGTKLVNNTLAVLRGTAPEPDRIEFFWGGRITSEPAAIFAPETPDARDGEWYWLGDGVAIGDKVHILVRPEAFTDFDAWRFWDGDGWSAQLDDASPITDQISNELSVSPLADGRYILVFHVGGITADVGVRFGDSPVGPFGDIHTIYHTPEPSTDPETFVYNAKAHPHLSRPGELLISYNVNTFDFWGDFFRDADIYRPRFIRLKLE